MSCILWRPSISMLFYFIVISLLMFSLCWCLFVIHVSDFLIHFAAFSCMLWPFFSRSYSEQMHINILLIYCLFLLIDVISMVHILCSLNSVLEESCCLTFSHMCFCDVVHRSGGLDISSALIWDLLPAPFRRKHLVITTISKKKEKPRHRNVLKVDWSTQIYQWLKLESDKANVECSVKVKTTSGKWEDWANDLTKSKLKLKQC